MINSKEEDYYSLEDIFSRLKFFIRFLLKRWWLMLLSVAFGAALGLAYYHLQKPKYEAVSTFILEDKSGGGSGGLAGLASQFGINVGSLTGGGNIFSGDNILSILSSKKVVEQVLLSRIDTSSNGITLADLYLDFSGLKNRWLQKPLLANLAFNSNNQTITPLQDSVLNVISEIIVKKNLSTERISKQGTIIKVQVTEANSLFARLMTQRLVEEAKKLYLNIRIGTAMDNIRQLQNRSDSLLQLLNNKSYSAAANQPLDINPGLKTAIVPGEIANRDKTVLATLYAEVTKNLEASKLKLSQQTPVIQLLDQPAELLRDNKKGLLFLLVGFSAAISIIYLICAFLFFIKKIKDYPQKNKSGINYEQNEKVLSTTL
ncbi:MAG TPA: Wzz/FepE/Etk N-terminal domain-containing protein [Flavisolibacter sp.]|nr:Wzz/FepE/Etk N-terminal domain-containing protein [Flavisolibacter sp.]